MAMKHLNYFEFSIGNMYEKSEIFLNSVEVDVCEKNSFWRCATNDN